MYDGAHSVTFINTETQESKNSWTDWYLIPSSRPVINPPAVNTNYVTIPGSNRIIDLTEVLTGYPTYSYREGSLEFLVDNGHIGWATLYSEIMNFLHGYSIELILDDDPGWFYEGRASVSSWKSGESNSRITIDYYLYPFKRNIQDTADADWLWDPFNFYIGVIRNYKDIVVSGSKTVSVVGSSSPVTPTVISSTAMTLVVDGTTYDLVKGDNKLTGLKVGDETYEFIFTGTGTVTIKLREESL